MSSTFSPGRAIAEALGFFVQRPVTLLAWTGVHMIIWSLAAGAVALVEANAARLPTEALILAPVGLWCVWLSLDVTLSAAIRSVLEPREASHAFLRLGRAERNLILYYFRRDTTTTVYTFAIFGGFFATVGVIILILNLGASAVAKAALVVPLMIGCAAAILYWVSRFSLSRTAAWDAERDADYRAYWTTHGHGWSLAALWALSNLIWLAMALCIGLALLSAWPRWPPAEAARPWMPVLQVLLVALALSVVTTLRRALCDRPKAMAYAAIGRRREPAPGMSSAALRAVTG